MQVEAVELVEEGDEQAFEAPDAHDSSVKQSFLRIVAVAVIEVGTGGTWFSV